MKALPLTIAVFACLCLQQANSAPCIAAPQDGERSVNDELLSTWPARDLQLLVDEYTYAQMFSRHQDALDAGFAPGDVVYGQTLIPGRSFGREAVRSWKRAYARAGHKEYLRRLLPMLRGRSPDSTLVAVALDSCLRAPA